MSNHQNIFKKVEKILAWHILSKSSRHKIYPKTFIKIKLLNQRNLRIMGKFAIGLSWDWSVMQWDQSNACDNYHKCETVTNKRTIE